MAQRRLVTFHAPLARDLSMRLIARLQEELKSYGAQHVHLTPEHLPDIVIMGDIDNDERRARGT